MDEMWRGRNIARTIGGDERRGEERRGSSAPAPLAETSEAIGVMLIVAGHGASCLQVRRRVLLELSDGPSIKESGGDMAYVCAHNQDFPVAKCSV